MATDSSSAPDPESPRRVAIVGAGPAGFYVADFMLKSKAPPVSVHMFERLPTPFGLVRSGVAPDHQGIKKVTKVFERIASHERFHFFGNVELGKDILHEELMSHYDQVCYATGSATDRRLNIPGEDLPGSHTATEFVGWYNGHPDYTDRSFDLSAGRAVVVGLGNVAMDVARLLAKDPAALEDTDIASYALEALQHSKCREVVLLGRRGPAQAAFTPREIQDIAELEGVELVIDGDPIDPPGDELSGDAKKNVEFLSEVSKRQPGETPRRVRLKFLCSPVELIQSDGRVGSVRIEKNELVDAGDGRLRAKGTGQYETLEAGLVFRSVGYRGVPLPDVPFDDASGTIPNQKGRVTKERDGAVVPGLYTVGWIKRGPSGLIGTNRNDAKETAECMLEDLANQPAMSREKSLDVLELVKSRGCRPISIAEWRRLDELEIAQGKARGKVREKFYSTEAMVAALTSG